MRQLLVNRDNVAVAGSLVGLISLLLGWLTLKPTRISIGVTHNLLTDIDLAGGAVILACWLACLALSLVGKQRLAAIALGIASNLILVFSFLLLISGAGYLLENTLPEVRVSPSAGFWFTLAGAYMVIFGARQTLHQSRAWKHIISWTGPAILVVLLFSGWFNAISILVELSGREERFLQELLQHVFLFGGSVAVGTVLGILLGIWATRSRRVEKPVFYFVNITQTIPSLALFGLLIAPLSALSFAFPVLREMGIRGVGATPAFIALIIYSLLPIVRNTFVGLRQVDPAVIDAGLGMGMTGLHIFRKIEAPLAAPLVLEGIRTASVQSVGLAAVAALIGAGGLGWFIFQGIGQAAPDLILLGVIPIIAMALAVDALMRAIIRLATPRGMTGGDQ